MKYLVLLLLPINVFAAAFSYSGDWRMETDLYHNLSLNNNNPGTVSSDYANGANGAPLIPTAVNKTKAYWLQRFKVKPELIVYDNVRIESEMIFLAGSALNSTNLGGSTNNMVAGGVMGTDNVHASLAVRRAWLNWSSDWGILTMGRQPFNFGLGMTFNSGDGLWDYYGDSVDRIAYKLMMGDVYFQLGADIRSEGAVNYVADNHNSFMAQLGYTEPESNMEIAFMWYFKFGSYGERVHTYDVFQKKTFAASNITLGVEAAYQKGTQLSFINPNQNETLQAFGLLFEFDWAPSSIDLGFRTGLATGNNGSNDNRDYCFRFNRAYKIAMLLFNEDLGIAGDSVHGSQGIGTDFNTQGAVFFAPYLKWTMFDNLTWGNTIAYAVTQKSAGGRNKHLGIEWDTDFTYMWKDNLETGLRYGMFFPAGYFATRATAVGLMATVGLKF
ncbi:MAG: hypothetical protein NTY22_02870 [Proteobacteria bacterium]|nr:hypothetical protein [Pseudomonadota bacterium]